MEKFLSLKCTYTVTEGVSAEENLEKADATLLIGDEAMREAQEFTGNIFDLGGLWHKHTGLPFVFALWIARKDSLAEKKELIKKLSEDLIAAKKYIPKNLSLLAEKAPIKKLLSEKELITYWNGISYDFTDEHLEGLMLFDKLAKEFK